MMQLLLKVWQFLDRLNIELLYDISVRLLGIYQVKLKYNTPTKMCTQMFTATLYTTAQKWETTQMLVNQ